MARLRGGTAQTSPTVTVVKGGEGSNYYGDVGRCRKALSGHHVLALECKGVNLSRKGEISLIQISTPSECFLFDVLDTNILVHDDPVIELATEILEDETICKIVHDCR